MVIAFVDLSGYTVQTGKSNDAEVADVIDGYYQLVARTGGRVVKFIGDAALLVYPEEDLERAVEGLLLLRGEVDAYLAERGWGCHVNVKVHVGTVMAGLYGPPDDLRWDVLGRHVNATARLPTRGFAISADARARLSPELSGRIPS